MMKFLCSNCLDTFNDNNYIVKHIMQKTKMGCLDTRSRLVIRCDKIMIDALKEAKKDRFDLKHFDKVKIILASAYL